jgi:hypothetical protein
MPHSLIVAWLDRSFCAEPAYGPWPRVLGRRGGGSWFHPRSSQVGREVTNFKVGDRVCMEPGVPDPNSVETRRGMYNVCRKLRFWATPPYAPNLLNGVFDGVCLKPYARPGLGCGPRQPAPLCRASRRLHFQASRQRQLRRGRHGGAAGGGHAGSHQGPHPSGRPRMSFVLLRTLTAGGGAGGGADRHGYCHRGSGGRLRQSYHR